MSENLKIWNAVKQPPTHALKQIQAGRLKGKSDINPMWRYLAMTEQFGMCGIGWKFEIVRLWTEPGPSEQVFAFAQINLYYKQGDQWSDPIPGIGGHMLAVKESSGIHANDEGYKMAITDALGTAMKMLGVAADIYAGLWDGSKYKVLEDAKTEPENPAQKAPAKKEPPHTLEDMQRLSKAIKIHGQTPESMKAICKKLGYPEDSKLLTVEQINALIKAIAPKEDR